jgi:hypothetical protein
MSFDRITEGATSIAGKPQRKKKLGNLDADGKMKEKLSLCLTN